MGQLVHGDCVAGMRSLDAGSVDAVVTDPPYGYGIGGQPWDSFAKLDEFETETRAWAEQALRVLRPGGLLAVFGAPRTIHRVAVAMEKEGGVVLDMLTWLFGNGAGINVKHGRLKPGHEPILLVSSSRSSRLRVEDRRIDTAGQPPRHPANVVLDEDVARELDDRVGPLSSGSRRPGVRQTIGMMKGSRGDDSPAIVGSSGSASRYFYVARYRGHAERPDHVVVKPLSLMIWLVGLVAAPGDVVLDPFMGTGTTALAAMKCGCDWLGYENVRGTFETAQRLIEQAQATQPTLFENI
jgi:DNA modification methylase